MLTLRTPIALLPKMRKDIADKFAGLGLETLYDCLFHFPIRHQDWRNVVSIADVQSGSEVTIAAQIVSIKGRRAWRRKVHITEASITDASGQKMSVVWFNQPFLEKWLKPKQAWFLSGKVTVKKEKLQMQNPMYERPGADPTHESLVPVYPSTAGLSQWHIRKVMKAAIELVHLVTDPLPAVILQEHELIDRATALQEIHFPSSPERAALALRRLKFDELLSWQIRWQAASAEVQRFPGVAIPFDEQAVREFVGHLPFQLTNDQRIVAWEIFQDLGKPEAMSRLVQGDVGSGKTVVAAMAAFLAIHRGYQVALLAPTLTLAEQHFQSLRTLLPQGDMQVALLTGKTARTDQDLNRSTLLQAVEAGAIHLLVSTHAAFHSQITWKNLGLVIVDEQQRFGVAQREFLLTQSTTHRPHFLSLTATPIPRTLALFLTGQLAISSIRQKPPGRTPIATTVVGPADRSVIDTAIRQTVEAGQQVYVITPLIEESDMLGVRAATTEYERMHKSFPNLRVALLHGSLPPETRVQTLQQFRNGGFDILVSTTVIEVGIDVPNATLIVIEGAERFGLAQLHQLRGRVGRGAAASTCLLVTDQDSPPARKRLDQVAATDDGFRLAELDLEQRGGGDVYGLRQSGLPDWKLATLADSDLMDLTKISAKRLLADWPEQALQMAAERPITTHRE